MKKHYLSKLERETNEKVASGEITTVYIPRLVTPVDIIKYILCSKIIKHKKDQELTQAQVAQMLEVNKSEVSKMFSYRLDGYSIERLIGMVETLNKAGAEIDLVMVFDEVKKRLSLFNERSKKRKGKLEASHP